MAKSRVCLIFIWTLLAGGPSRPSSINPADGGATRYDRCAHTFMSAISIAATLCYWL